MGKYGETAVRAVALLQSSGLTVEDAWRRAARETFPDAPAARAKVCPREAFFGLCQDGLLKDIAADRCAPSSTSKNRQYAIAAVQVLANHPSLAEGSRAELWRRVMHETGADPEKRHNQQLDVVLAPRSRDLLTTP